MQPLEIQRVVQPSLMAGDRQCHLRQTSSENSGEMKRLACLNEAATQPPLALAGPVVAAGPAYQTKKNIMKPQTFDGKDSIHSFLAHFEVCANFNSWTEEEKVSWLQWCLKGRAQQLLWDLSAGQLTNYDDLSSKLKQRFGSENQCEVYKLELRNRRRGPRETLSDLMQDIRRLMVLAYSAKTSEMWESVAINAFLEAVDDPDLALEVRKRGPSTLDGAYRDALLLEGFVKTCVKGDHGKGKSQVRATTDKNVDLSREVEELRGLLKRQETTHKQ